MGLDLDCIASTTHPRMLQSQSQQFISEDCSTVNHTKISNTKKINTIFEGLTEMAAALQCELSVLQKC
jgi:hypothetical protein